MNTLIIGGNRFIGFLLTQRLLARGHNVTHLNRGNLPDPFGTRVTRIKADRTDPRWATYLPKTGFDAVVDFACFTGAEARTAVEAFSNRVGHYILISTGQTYLVRQGPTAPFKESDYDGLLMPQPSDPIDLSNWKYGIFKRDAEDIIAQAGPALPSTRIRIPMVNGPRDYYRRIESYLVRLLDHKPLLLPRAARPCRHVYGDDVARLLADILLAPHTFGQAYNLCSSEDTTLLQIIYLLADRLGIKPPACADVSDATLAENGLHPRDVSPFSSPWMSRIDPTKAFQSIGWRATPLETQLDIITEFYLSNPPSSQPDNYANRDKELAIFASLKR